jgi:hypothetical protein
MLNSEVMLALWKAEQRNPHAHHLHDLAAEARGERRTRRPGRLRRWTVTLRGWWLGGPPAQTPGPST